MTFNNYLESKVTLSWFKNQQSPFPEASLIIPMDWCLETIEYFLPAYCHNISTFLVLPYFTPRRFYLSRSRNKLDLRIESGRKNKKETSVFDWINSFLTLQTPHNILVQSLTCYGTYVLKEDCANTIPNSFFKI